MHRLRISVQSPSRALEKSPVDRAITALAVGAVNESRSGGLPDGPVLDLTFLLSTEDDRPPFQGMRMGGFTREQQTLFFEAAVPAAVGQSARAPAYVAAVLEDAVDNATEYFQEQGVAFDAQRWQQALVPLLASLDTDSARRDN